jgi:undecaprenyl-diphosphatase
MGGIKMILKYIILGIIQGFTEPLPVSSSGHIILFKALFNTEIFSSLNFEIISNFGSFIAIFLLFFKDIKKIIKDFFLYIFKKDTKPYKDSFKYVIYIIISSIPAAILGLFLKDKIENITNLNYLGFAFLITSLALFLVRNNKGVKKDVDLTIKDAIIIGLFQSMALMPGISRSGMTLVGTLICKLNIKDALKYTFMLYFPVSIGAFILGLNDFLATPNLDIMLIPYLAGAISAFCLTYLSFKFMAKLVNRGKLLYFSYYCLFIAGFIFLYFH